MYKHPPIDLLKEQYVGGVFITKDGRALVSTSCISREPNILILGHIVNKEGNTYFMSEDTSLFDLDELYVDRPAPILLRKKKNNTYSKFVWVSYKPEKQWKRSLREKQLLTAPHYMHFMEVVYKMARVINTGYSNPIHMIDSVREKGDNSTELLSRSFGVARAYDKTFLVYKGMYVGNITDNNVVILPSKVWFLEGLVRELGLEVQINA